MDRRQKRNERFADDSIVSSAIPTTKTCLFGRMSGAIMMSLGSRGMNRNENRQGVSLEVEKLFEGVGQIIVKYDVCWLNNFSEISPDLEISRLSISKSYCCLSLEICDQP
jgi:hypothetical protein